MFSVGRERVHWKRMGYLPCFLFPSFLSFDVSYENVANEICSLFKNEFDNFFFLIESLIEKVIEFDDWYTFLTFSKS